MIRKERITNIEEIKNDGQYVYDFEVPETQSFAANDIYVHNTDSVFVKVDKDSEMDPLIKNMNEMLKKFLMTKFDLPAYIVFLEYEKKFGKLIMLDKKRYTGVLTEKDGNEVFDLFSRGTENIKKNTITIARNAFIELIDMIVKEEANLQKTKKWLQQLKHQILYEEIPPEQLIIMTKVSKPIDKYKSKSTHVRLAERLIKEHKMLPIVESKRTWGARLEYIVIAVETTDPKTGKITTSQEGITIDEYNGIWDRKYYWDVQVYAPIMRVLQAVWPEENWENHSIVLYEKEQRRVAREEAKIQKEKEKIEKQKEREQKKKEREKLKLAREKERERKRQEREEKRKEREKEKAKKAKEVANRKAEREKKKKEKESNKKIK